MTQISAIYQKRSRSTQNQLGNSKTGAVANAKNEDVSPSVLTQHNSNVINGTTAFGQKTMYHNDKI